MTPLRIYVAWASHDLRSAEQGIDLARDNRALLERLSTTAHGLAGGEYAGGPGWRSWRARTGTLLQFLFPTRPKTESPHTVDR